MPAAEVAAPAAPATDDAEPAAEPAADGAEADAPAPAAAADADAAAPAGDGAPTTDDPLAAAPRKRRAPMTEPLPADAAWLLLSRIGTDATDDTVADFLEPYAGPVLRVNIIRQHPKAPYESGTAQVAVGDRAAATAAVDALAGKGYWPGVATPVMLKVKEGVVINPAARGPGGPHMAAGGGAPWAGGGAPGGGGHPGGRQWGGPPQGGGGDIDPRDLPPPGVEPTCSKVFVSNLPAGTGEAELRPLLEGCGPVHEIHFAPPRGPGDASVAAFVWFTSRAGTDAALARINGLEWGGSRVLARVARPRIRQAAPAWGGGGGWGGGGYGNHHGHHHGHHPGHYAPHHGHHQGPPQGYGGPAGYGGPPGGDPNGGGGYGGGYGGGGGGGGAGGAPVADPYAPWGAAGGAPGAGGAAPGAAAAPAATDPAYAQYYAAAGYAPPSEGAGGGGGGGAPAAGWAGADAASRAQAATAWAPGTAPPAAGGGAAPTMPAQPAQPWGGGGSYDPYASAYGGAGGAQ